MLLKKNDITYAESRLLSESNRALHAFAGRTGGISKAPYSTLNAATHVGDDEKDVQKNRSIILDSFDAAGTKFFTVNQVHGSNVAECSGSDISRVDADAIITNRANSPIGILTADCLPILFYDPISAAIGAAHAGWRGTVKNVAARTVEKMREAYGSRPDDIIASLGPCIGPCCYTVKENVTGEFESAFGLIGGYFKNTGDATFSLDLTEANKTALIAAGLKESNIDAVKHCTSCENDVFFSYRKKSGNDTGRQISFIMLRGNE